MAEQSHIHPFSLDCTPSAASIEPNITWTKAHHGGREYVLNPPENSQPAPAPIAINSIPEVPVPSGENLMDTVAPHPTYSRRGSNIVSQEDALSLRAEIEQLILRRMVQTLRNDRAGTPPSYYSGDNTRAT
ncbi:hypothetical protein PHLCEN_2v5453 [Hermanssonia centrifuga]|uniref:Uncharacterized protein n=1 Tax=Hermanssonia centrifuga TaxID=98765 RepID=A0A2R6P2E2_9APHY|nr:hypothetical protein PHLCEN_2v5453 [Hermanssonia centrifuga]